MTGEPKPGGLEVVDLNGLLQQAWDRLHRPDADVPGAMVVLQAMLVALERPLTPAEPAEARIRELEARIDYLRTSRDGHAAESHKQFLRATAAEAKLAKAKEALERIRDHVESAGDAPPDDVMRDIARQTLAALQQAGEVG